MAKDSYPGWAPSYGVVSTIAGKHRTCMIIDLRSDAPLSRAQLVALAERVEATIERGEGSIEGLEAVLITPEQFDPVVCGGLRLPRLSEDGRECSGAVPLPDG